MTQEKICGNCRKRFQYCEADFNAGISETWLCQELGWNSNKFNKYFDDICEIPSRYEPREKGEKDEYIRRNDAKTN